MLSYHGAPFRGRANAKAVKASASRRRGLASLMAMLYLVVFAALALGFYAQTNMSVQVSNNERRSKESLAAAEAGLQFIRYQLSRITIPMQPVGMPQLTDSQVFEEVGMDLQAAISEVPVSDIIYDTNPLNDATEGVDPPRIEIPADPTAYIAVTEQGPWFRCTLEQSGRDMIVTTVGKSANGNTNSGGRAIQVRFKAKEWPNKVFDYGLASPGPVNVTVAKLMVAGTPAQQAGILSTYTGGTPVTIGNASSTALEPTGIAGNIILMQGAPAPSYVGANYTVGGLKTAATINAAIDSNRLTEAPEWPTPDVSVFTSYATTKYTGGSGVFDNIYLDPLTTPSVTFDQTSTIRGVLYVKKGVTLAFTGGVNLQCVIVGEPKGPMGVNDTIKFSGNGVAKKPLSTLPNEPKFAGLHELTGIFILAPKWDVSFAGSFVSAAGSIVAEKITFTGNSPATIAGSLVNLGPYPLNITGSSALTLSDPGLEQIPGVRFTERFAPKKGSYKEVNAEKFAKVITLPPVVTPPSTPIAPPPTQPLEPITGPLAPLTTPLAPLTGGI